MSTRSAGKAWSAQRAYYWLASLPLFFFGLFFVLPLIRVVIRGFLEPKPGMQNFERIFFDGPYISVLLNTLQISGGVTLACLLIAYPVAYFGARLKGTAYTIYLGLVIVPIWISVVVKSFAWLVVFQRQGIVTSALMGLGLIDEPIRLLQTPISVGVGMVHVMLPFMMLPLLTTMRSIDPVLIKAGEVLGAGPVRLFFRIYLPLTLPGVSAGVLLVFISSLGFYITPALLGGAKSMTIAVLIRQQAAEFLDWPMASALATVLLVTALVIYVVYSRITRNLNEARS